MSWRDEWRKDLERLRATGGHVPAVSVDGHVMEALDAYVQRLEKTHCELSTLVQQMPVGWSLERTKRGWACRPRCPNASKCPNRPDVIGIGSKAADALRDALREKEVRNNNDRTNEQRDEALRDHQCADLGTRRTHE